MCRRGSAEGDVFGNSLRHTDPAPGKTGRRVPGAELVSFPGSGHFPWLEEPDRFRAAVTGWLDRLPLAANAAAGTRV